MISRMIPHPKTRDFARRLLVYEAAAGNSSASNIPAVFLVSEKLRRPLSTLAGVIGFRSLVARALTLAKSEVHSLNTVRVNPDGSLEGLSELHSDETAEAGVMLIAQLLGLLSTLIGESLTLRLVQDVWPNLPFDDTNSGEIKLT